MEVEQIKSTMKAVYVTERPQVGQVPDKIHIDDRVIPAPSHASLKEEEILVQVKAFSINFDDVNITQGTFLGGLPGMQCKPGKDALVIGSDFAGVITALGSKVEKKGNFKVGQRVCGINKVQTTFGQASTWAEHTVSIPDNVVPIPDDVSYEDAAAMVMPMTVIHGLLEHQRPKGNENILVIGASGGIGSMLLQILRKSVTGNDNLHITAVCSGRNAEFVKGLGANQVIDYTKSAPKKQLQSLKGATGTFGAHEYDIVYDVVGGRDSYETGKAALRSRRNRIISAVGPVAWLGERKLSRLEQIGLVSKMIWRTYLRNKLPGPQPYYHLAVHTEVSLGAPSFSIAFDNRVGPVIAKLVDIDNVSEFQEAIRLVQSHRAQGKVVVAFR